ncbi:GNAT family N-acetyltransferase [Flavobacterium sp. DGU38]|uniref:GNAT family N-acetyltransferase n=1 Tax=Flavobacterium calami TaxID=3139144 RepID=A0ABU9IIC7_9FLAO
MNLQFNIAEMRHLVDIVKLLAEDKLGTTRENFKDPLPETYISAFMKISSDSSQELIVVENENKEVIGTLQLSFIQYLTYQGGIRAQKEAVRIREIDRGKGYGVLLFQWAINRAKERGAHLLQLSSDKRRPEAIKFYEKLGFVSSHEGMKMLF